MEDWVLGVVLSLLAAVAASLGDNLVKWSFRKQHQVEASRIARGLDPGPPTPLYKRPAWVAGNFNLVVVNVTLNLISFSFADASILIPMGGVHLLLNIPMAMWLNEEHPSKAELACNLVIVAGVGITLAGGNHSNVDYTVDELFRNLVRVEFLVATGVMLLLFVVCTQGLMRASKPWKRRLGLTAFSGLVGVVTQVAAKSTSECISNGAWAHPFMYGSILVAIFFAISQVVLLNKCLDLYDATFVVPVVNAIIIVLGSLYAGAYFRELDRWKGEAVVLGPIGILLTSIGISALAVLGSGKRKDGVTDPDDDDDDEDLMTSLVVGGDAESEVSLEHSGFM